MTRKDPLPEFERPPITEMVLGAQFDALSAVKSFHAGLLSTLLLDYPIITEQPALPPQFEVFGAPSPQPFSFEFMEGTPVPRYWFHSSDRSQLIQFQNDRLLHNWIKVSEGHEYPRFDSQRRKLSDDIDCISKFLSDSKLGEIKFNQAEVSYLNAIVLEHGTVPAAVLHKTFNVWSNSYADDQKRQFEQAVIQFSYLLEDNGKPYARMHVLIAPGLRTIDMRPVIKFDITVRGKPDGIDKNAVLVFIDKAREAIVRAFASLTRPEMHKIWGRTDA